MPTTHDPIDDYDGSQGPLFVNPDREEYDDSDDTREIDLAAVEAAYAEAATEARIQREQEAEMARRDLWAVGD
jgi:hypothetical protein